MSNERYIKGHETAKIKVCIIDCKTCVRLAPVEKKLLQDARRKRLISLFDVNRGGFHFNSFARQSLSWPRAVSFHAVANLRAETEDAGNRSK
ncbi:hypothetical protein PUN28_016783 [Cardiocondyla obscurior]|uniref:Uncharacterized protein n=1 Tax=Cardiocondyla obscurior TaxID=286306 RepID=A0AAW2ENN8_9HYME